MTDRERVKIAIERNVKAVGLRAGIGRGTAVTTARARSGLACEVEEGDFRMTVDMSEKYGGSGAGPNPGVLARASLASCLTIGYLMWAARLDVPIDALEVAVHADYDVRGELGVDPDVPPGYLRMRYVVTVESSAPDEEVLRVLDTADRHSSIRDDFARAIELEREVRLGGPS